jgi:phosphopantothenate---cysteine ligase (ATP)
LTLPTQLETDEELLIPKARTALTRYGHQAVIGNDLHKRKYEVVLVENDENGKPDGFKETWLRLVDLEKEKREQGKSEDEIKHLEIEELIIEELVKRHEAWIAG